MNIIKKGALFFSSIVIFILYILLVINLDNFKDDSKIILFVIGAYLGFQILFTIYFIKPGIIKSKAWKRLLKFSTIIVGIILVLHFISLAYGSRYFYYSRLELSDYLILITAGIVVLSWTWIKMYRKLLKGLKPSRKTNIVKYMLFPVNSFLLGAILVYSLIQIGLIVKIRLIPSKFFAVSEVLDFTPLKYSSTKVVHIGNEDYLYLQTTPDSEGNYRITLFSSKTKFIFSEFDCDKSDICSVPSEDSRMPTELSNYLKTINLRTKLASSVTEYLDKNKLDGRQLNIIKDNDKENLYSLYYSHPKEVKDKFIIVIAKGNISTGEISIMQADATTQATYYVDKIKNNSFIPYEWVNAVIMDKNNLFVSLFASTNNLQIIPIYLDNEFVPTVTAVESVPIHVDTVAASDLDTDYGFDNNNKFYVMTRNYRSGEGLYVNIIDANLQSRDDYQERKNVFIPSSYKKTIEDYSNVLFTMNTQKSLSEYINSTLVGYTGNFFCGKSCIYYTEAYGGYNGDVILDQVFEGQDYISYFTFQQDAKTKSYNAENHVYWYGKSYTRLQGLTENENNEIYLSYFDDYNLNNFLNQRVETYEIVKLN